MKTKELFFEKAFDDYLDFFQKTSFDEKQKAATIKIMEWFLPPPMPIAVSEIIHWVIYYGLNLPGIDYGLLINLSNNWKSFERLDGRKITKKDCVATSYPLYYGAKTLIKKLEKNQAFDLKKILEIYLRVCGGPDKLEFNLEKPIYYADILAVRSLLLIYGANLNNSTTGEDIWEIKREFIRILPDLHTIKNTDVYDKVSRTRSLLNGKRRFGIAAFHPENIGPRGVRSKRDHNKDALHQNRNIKEFFDEGLDSLTDGAGFELEIIQTLPTEEDQNEDLESLDFQREIQVNRRTPPGGSRLNPCDDRRAFRPRVYAMEARNVTSLSDMSRLSITTISFFMNFLASKGEKDLLFYAWLLITTGLRPQRIKDLVINGRARPKYSKGVHLETRRLRLTYDIEGGATDFSALGPDQPSEQAISQIILPDIASEFIEMMRQIEDLDIRFTALSRSFHNHYPGLRPTLERLVSSYSLLTAKTKVDELTASLLSGTVPTHLRAQSNYYQTNLKKINSLYRDTNKVLVIEIGERLGSDIGLELNNFLSKIIKFSKRLPTGLLGSQVARPVESLKPLIQALQNNFEKLVIEFLMATEDEQQAIVCSLIQLQHLNLYLQQQLFMNLRPVGQRTVISIVDEKFGGCAADKDSARFRERHWVPLPSIFLTQIVVCRKDLEFFEHFLLKSKTKLKIDESISKKTDLARSFTLQKEKNRSLVTMDLLTGSLFRKKLENFGLKGLFPGRDNMIRHVSASYFREIVPEVVLDEMLGHEREGLDLMGPWSTVQSDCLIQSKEEMEKLADFLGLIVMDLGEIW